MRTFAILVLLSWHGFASGQSSLFREQVAPLLENKCLRCHGGEHSKGELDLSTPAGLKKGSASGEILSQVRGEPSLLLVMVEEGKMPPKEKLSAKEIQSLRDWVNAGAKWEGPALQQPAKVSTQDRAGADWWSLQPIRRAVPAANGNPIDSFVLAALKAKGLHPAREADRRTYIRRVTFDLLGLPPTPQEIQAFEQDQSANAYERLVDRLLASPHYGERWGRHWLDVVRFAESHGYETNELRRNAWPYRDWVIKAFNDDKPFERFVLEQLAGDVVGKGDPAVEVATGFLVGGTHDIVGNQTPEGMAQQRQDDLYDMVSTTGSSFLGLTVNCARCHDHKFDPITQRDYYALQAVFAGVQHGSRTIADPKVRQHLVQLEKQERQLNERIVQLEAETSLFGAPRPRVNIETFAPVAAKLVRFTVLATARNDEPCIDELEIWSADKDSHNVALASLGAKASASSNFPDATIHRIEHLNDGKTGNSHSWISNEKGKGWAQIELAEPKTINRIVWGRDRESKFEDRLAVKYRIESSLDGKSWSLLCTESERLQRKPSKELAGQLDQLKNATEQKKAVKKEIDELRSRLNIYCGTFKVPEKAFWLKRGDPMQTMGEVQPAAIASVGSPFQLETGASDSDRRMALARWITDKNNPLPARVMVNRIWHYHFGCGLVSTPSDFGFNGDRPSHPKLLDWLAGEFLANGGRLKPLHRLIVLSNTYRQSSVVADDANRQGERIDANNRLLWRFPRRRLEAEALRDSILAVCGNLDTRMGGPGYDLWDYSNYVVVFKPKYPLPADAYRRMVYQFKPRTQQDSTFGAFDCPDATLTMPRRNVSTTPLQALNLLNSRFMLDQSARFAERLRKEAGSEVKSQIERGFLLAFGRLPTAMELANSEKIAVESGLDVFCRALLNANEFLFVD
jgi:hypothetical protein